MPTQINCQNITTTSYECCENDKTGQFEPCELFGENLGTEWGIGYGPTLLIFLGILVLLGLLVIGYFCYNKKRKRVVGVHVEETIG